jgi:uncharacterized protein (DUF2141 family)
MNKRLFQVVPAVATLLFSSMVHAADIEITVSKVVQAAGKLSVALYDSADTFRKTPIAVINTPALPGTMELAFRDLPAGEYGVALYHDVNANNKLDSKLMGTPKEPFGFSTLKGSVMGPPGWDSVKFILPANGVKIAIPLSE